MSSGPAQPVPHIFVVVESLIAQVNKATASHKCKNPDHSQIHDLSNQLITHLHSDFASDTTRRTVCNVMVARGALSSLLTLSIKIDAESNALHSITYPNDAHHNICSLTGSLLASLLTRLDHMTNAQDHHGAAILLQLIRSTAHLLPAYLQQVSTTLHTAAANLPTHPASHLVGSFAALLLGCTHGLGFCLALGSPPTHPELYTTLATTIAKEHLLDHASSLLLSIAPSLPLPHYTFIARNLTHTILLALSLAASTPPPQPHLNPHGYPLAVPPPAAHTLRTHHLADTHILTFLISHLSAPPTLLPPRYPTHPATRSPLPPEHAPAPLRPLPRCATKHAPTITPRLQQLIRWAIQYEQFPISAPAYRTCCLSLWLAVDTWLAAYAEPWGIHELEVACDVLRVAVAFPLAHVAEMALEDGKSYWGGCAGWEPCLLRISCSVLHMVLFLLKRLEGLMGQLKEPSSVGARLLLGGWERLKLEAHHSLRALGLALRVLRELTLAELCEGRAGPEPFWLSGLVEHHNVVTRVLQTLQRGPAFDTCRVTGMIRPSAMRGAALTAAIFNFVPRHCARDAINPSAVPLPNCCYLAFSRPALGLLRDETRCITPSAHKTTVLSAALLVAAQAMECLYEWGVGPDAEPPSLPWLHINSTCRAVTRAMLMPLWAFAMRLPPSKAVWLMLQNSLPSEESMGRITGLLAKGLLAWSLDTVVPQGAA